jgi:hypothetical protein
MFYIYFLEKNGIPFYIGKCKNKSQRKSLHKKNLGKDIEFFILDSVFDWKFWEKHYISLFKSWGFELTNKNEGGGGPTKWSEVQKAKINPARIKKIKENKNRGFKISQALENHSQYYTVEVKLRMSHNLRGKHTGPFSKEHIENIKISRRKTSKRVIQSDKQNNFIKEWESKGQAAEWVKEMTNKTSNIVSQIKDCILGRQKTAFGFKWKYK